MGWLRLVGSLKLQVSFANEPYKRDYVLHKRPIILRRLLIVATPYHLIWTAFRVNKWTDSEHVPSLQQMADLPSRELERHSDPILWQHIKVFEKLNLSLVELIHPSQTEWMSPISLFDKIRVEIQWDLARTTHTHTHTLPPERRPEGIDPPRSFSWTQFGCFCCW